MKSEDVFQAVGFSQMKMLDGGSETQDQEKIKNYEHKMVSAYCPILPGRETDLKNHKCGKGQNIKKNKIEYLHQIFTDPADLL